MMKLDVITKPKGFKAAGLASGIKKIGKDLALIVSETPALAAATYTQNIFKAAPLQVNQAHLEKDPYIQAIIINSGVANAATGQEGYAQAEEMASYLAEGMGMQASDVLVASTGVIGVPLPMKTIKNGIDKIIPILSVDGARDAAEAILTTDTKAKTAIRTLSIDGINVSIAGIAKGSGMICPNMSTMLGFITTDAMISENALQGALKTSVDRSFNRITVDGDSSTNDMVAILANGCAKNSCIEEGTESFADFQTALQAICIDLAMQIAADGEGASHLIEVEVCHAKTEEDAEKMAKSIAGSMLVKAAIFGKDPNWGRIACAMGYSGASFDPEKTQIMIGDVIVADKGRGVAFDVEKIKGTFAQEKVVIKVELGAGNDSAKAWGCDLSYDYVRINADYTS